MLTSANCSFRSGSDVYQYYCLPRLIGSIARDLMYTMILLLTSADWFYCSDSDVYQYTIAYLG